MATPIHFEGISDEVIAELAKGRHAKETLELIKLRQQYGQFAGSPEGEHRSIEGMGNFKMSIPPLAYHYWGQRLGYDCWKDPSFTREFARDNPSVRVASAPAAQVGYRATNPKFAKSYSWPSTAAK